MGMFDDVIYEYTAALPDGYEGREFQSKDFECSMVKYRISPEGRMLQPIWHTEDVPKAERPFPDAPEGDFLSMCGSMRTVYDRWHDMNYHGDVHFYTLDANKKWHGYFARFTEGQLTSVRPDAETEDAPTAADSEERKDG